MTPVVKHSALRRTTLILREGVALAQAQFELIAAQFLVRTRATGSLLSPAKSDPLMSFAQADPRADQLATSVRRAADHGLFRPHCLVRAIATNRMLERRGIHGSCIRIGVLPHNAGIVAHAWVEYGGHVIGDTQANVGRYSVLTDVQLVERV